MGLMINVKLYQDRLRGDTSWLDTTSSLFECERHTSVHYRHIEHAPAFTTTAGGALRGTRPSSLSPSPTRNPSLLEEGAALLAADAVRRTMDNRSETGRGAHMSA